MAEYMMIEGFDVNECDNLKWTPLHYAAAHGNDRAVKALIWQGADVNARNADSLETPLHIAVKHGRYSTVSALLGGGADVNAIDREFNTPISIADKMGFKKLVIQLTRCNMLKEPFEKTTDEDFATRIELYRIFSVLMYKGSQIKVVWINTKRKRPVWLYESVVNGYTYMPADQRLLLEICVDGLFTEEEAIQTKFYLERVMDGSKFIKQRVNVPINYRQGISLLVMSTRNGLESICTKNTLWKKSPPFPLKNCIVSVRKIKQR